jgi:uncharacterized lipoprotein YmbA
MTPNRAPTVDSREQAARSAGPVFEVRVGVGPVTFPAYLKRSRMASRVANNELDFLETERWAEPLEEAFAHTLAENVSVLLRTQDVMRHPWYATAQPEYSVRVDVARFERDGTGPAHLQGSWEVRDDTGATLVSEPMDISEPADDPTVAASVQAQSRAVARLSRQIADAIRRAGS